MGIIKLNNKISEEEHYQKYVNYSNLKTEERR